MADVGTGAKGALANGLLDLEPGRSLPAVPLRMASQGFCHCDGAIPFLLYLCVELKRQAPLGHVARPAAARHPRNPRRHPADNLVSSRQARRPLLFTSRHPLAAAFVRHRGAGRLLHALFVSVVLFSQT